MAISNKIQENLNAKKSDISGAASDLLNEGEKKASELYNKGLDKMDEMEDCIKEYSDELLKKVQDNPLTSVLVAAGIGFLISSMLKK